MRIVVADRHPLFRDILCGVAAEAVPGHDTVAAHSFAELVDLAAQPEVALVLLDPDLDGAEGLAGLLRLLALRPSLSVVVVSAMEGDAILRYAQVCGAAGFVPKSMARPQMIETIRRAAAGRSGQECGGRVDVLTQRERMVLEALARGRSNKQIAFELQVTYATVKAHMSSVLRKLMVHSRAQAVVVTRVSSTSGATSATAASAAEWAC